ncbi:hypothetical protein NQZ68_000779 [Dissostichus eleginoides]|nr:hypothetical protein NQZ68_000779 [Dissostichus eleginoides]
MANWHCGPLISSLKSNLSLFLVWWQMEVKGQKAAIARSPHPFKPPPPSSTNTSRSDYSSDICIALTKKTRAGKARISLEAILQKC